MRVSDMRLASVPNGVADGGMPCEGLDGVFCDPRVPALLSFDKRCSKFAFEGD